MAGNGSRLLTFLFLFCRPKFDGVEFQLAEKPTGTFRFVLVLFAHSLAFLVHWVLICLFMSHTVFHVSTQLVLSYSPYTSTTLHGVILSVRTNIFGKALNTPDRLYDYASCIINASSALCHSRVAGNSFAYYHRSLFFNYILHAPFSRLS